MRPFFLSEGGKPKSERVFGNDENKVPFSVSRQTRDWPDKRDTMFLVQPMASSPLNPGSCVDPFQVLLPDCLSPAPLSSLGSASPAIPTLYGFDKEAGVCRPIKAGTLVCESQKSALYRVCPVAVSI